MLLTALSGKYKIGDTIVVNVDDGSVSVNAQRVSLRRQLFLALLLLMEQRLHEAAVPYDDFSKTLTDDKQRRGDVISNDSIRAIVSELNKKLESQLIVHVPGIGYKLDAEICSQEPREPVIPPAAVSEFSRIAEKLNAVIDNIPELIGSTIAMAFSAKTAYNTNDALNITVALSTDGKDAAWPGSPISPLTTLAPVLLQSKREDAYRIGDVVLRHWEIVRCISKGSYSTVYEAHRTVHGVVCKSAIKIIHSSVRSVPIAGMNGLASQTISSSCLAQHELAYMMELKGTGYIVSYEDHDTVDLPDGSQDTIIRMELLEPLSEVPHSIVLATDNVVKMGIDICKALELCADLNIVHRDVKPSNIFLTRWGGYKLGDFSAAATIGDQLEINQIGTLMYMAPEVYRGETFSANIDTYSLGLVMYELLNGNKVPFLREDGPRGGMPSSDAALSRRLSGEPLPEISGVSRALQSVILKACAVDPTERFHSSLEMRKALEELP